LRLNSQRNAALPGEEVVLAEGDGFGGVFSAGGGDDEFEHFFAHLFDGFFAGDDGAGVEVDEVGHATGEVGVGGDFEGGADGIAGGGAEAGGEEHHVAAAAGEGCGAFDVVAGGAVEGEAAVLADVRRVLEAMARNIYLVGPVGAGKAIKAINQMLAGVHMVAAAEAFALAQKLEIDKDMLKQVIGSSSGASWMFLNKLDAMSDRNFKPGFKQRLMKKDVQIAVDEGRNIPLPLAGLALQLYNMSEKDIGEKDFSAIAEYFLGDE